MLPADSQRLRQRDDAGTIVSRDFESLSLFRPVFALYLLSDFFVTTFPFFDDFYGATGILPLSALAADAHAAGLQVILPLVEIVDRIRPPALFAALYAAALVAFAVGFRTRWANAIVLVLNAYLYWRNPYLDSGAETLARLLLLWCLFLPMGRHWSIDAALDPKPRDRPYPVLPFLALRVQIGSLYLFAALFKIAGVPWRDGQALAWALSDNVFGVTAPAQFMLTHAPGLLYWVNYAVIGFQLAFPFLIYCPWRNDLVRALALAGSVLMHASFIFFLNVGGFPFVCLSMLLLLVPDHWIDRLLRARRQRLAGVTIYYEPGCGFCERVALILREFLLAETARVLPASADAQAERLLVAHNSWVVEAPDGTTYLKWRAMSYLFRQNPLSVPLAALGEREPLRGALDRLYDVIGANRKRLSPLARFVLPFRSPGPPGRLALSLCGGLMGLAFLSNAFGLARLSFPVLYRFDQLTGALQVRQSWEVFAPGPTHFRRQYQIVAKLSDGATIDLMQALPRPLIWTGADGAVHFASPRWTKYFTRFPDFKEPAWQGLGQYLCRQALARLPAGASVREVELTLLTEPVAGTPSDPQPRIERVFACG
jgi:Vitamin K-dependent gamma-carboxylase